MYNPISVSQLTMTKLVHHSKAPSHCLLHMKIKVLLHNSPPLYILTQFLYKKNANIQNSTPRMKIIQKL